jgi:hypothetical protein
LKFLDKRDFIERYLQDQEDRKKPPKQKSIKKKSILPFKEETYLDIINLFREKFGEELEVIKENDVTIKYNGEAFNIKIIAKRERVNS